jgi:hypothetical protein
MWEANGDGTPPPAPADPEPRAACHRRMELDSPGVGRAISAAGWHSQDASDLLAVLGPRLVGIPANRIPHYLKRLRGRTFRSWQAEVESERRKRHGRLVELRVRNDEELGQEGRRQSPARRTQARLTSSQQGRGRR